MHVKLKFNGTVFKHDWKRGPILILLNHIEKLSMPTSVTLTFHDLLVANLGRYI